ncbi:MAG TPA: cation:proton antiporter [Gaiellaceae bacterium]|nr:cation:proton antiporter [Gaiellaceae bacterium]
MRPELTSLLLVGAAAFAAPLAVGLVPWLRLPPVVLEIVLGIAIGPSVLDWAELDEPVRLLGLIGLAFLLLLAGLELDLHRLRGRLLRLSAGGFVLSFALAISLAVVLDAVGLVESPLLIAIIASATSLGIVISVLEDAGESMTTFGQTVLAGASIADVGTIILLSLFFSGHAGLGARLTLLAAFGVFVAAVGLTVAGAARSMRVSDALVRLQDTTAQIRVRGAFLLLLGFVVLADRLGLEAILGAFVAGAVLKLADRDDAMTHTHFHEKLSEIGFGVFVPFFFVSSGMAFDARAVLGDPATLALVPIFVALLLVARALPALLYRPSLGARPAAAAGLLQATSLGFIVVATRIGMDLGLIAGGPATAFVAAGLVSVLVFPLAALTLLQQADRPAAQEGPIPAPLH